MVEETSNPEKKELGELLIEGDFIKPEVLDHVREVANRSNKRLTEVLLDEEVISPDTLATILSLQYNVPAIDLRHVQVQTEAIALVPEEVAREHQIVPLTIEGDTLSVAMEDPENLWSLDELARYECGRCYQHPLPAHLQN
jgi:type IV pilus assembly protein PilB